MWPWSGVWANTVWNWMVPDGLPNSRSVLYLSYCRRRKKNMSKSNRFLSFQSNKWLFWCKALLSMHGLCLCVSDSVKIKSSTRSPNCLFTRFCCTAGEWSWLSPLPSLLYPAPLASPPWYPSRNSCHENYETKKCPSQPDSRKDLRVWA